MSLQVSILPACVIWAIIKVKKILKEKGIDKYNDNKFLKLLPEEGE